MNNYGATEENKGAASGTSLAQKLKDFTSKAFNPSASGAEEQKFEQLNTDDLEGKMINMQNNAATNTT